MSKWLLSIFLVLSCKSPFKTQSGLTSFDGREYTPGYCAHAITSEEVFESLAGRVQVGGLDQKIVKFIYLRDG